LTSLLNYALLLVSIWKLWNSLYLIEERDKQLSYINRDLEKPFIEVKMNSAIKSMKLKSAPGIDQIDHKVISSFPYKYLDFIVKIYNNILSEGSFPEQWKQSLIVLIPKSDGSSFCPISLLPCFLKIMEKNYIQSHTMAHRIATCYPWQSTWVQTG